MPLFERYEAKFEALEAWKVKAEATIQSQGVTIQELVKVQADNERFLDMRQISILLQPELIKQFMTPGLKFGKLDDEQRATLDRAAPAGVYRIVNFFGVEGANVVHYRRKVTAAKLKEYLLNAPLTAAFSAQEIDAFLQYLNQVLLRRNPPADIFKQEVTLGTEDMRTK